MRLAIADENQHPLHDELISSVAAAATETGLDARRLSDPAREGEFDVLLMLGSAHAYPSFLAAPHRTRRICWYGENLPAFRASSVERIARALPSARLLDLVHDTVGRLAGPKTRDRILRLREQAAVEREWGRNARELSRAHAWFDELVVSSRNRVAGAALVGWQARQVAFGYHAAMFGPLVAASEGDRDIDVLFLGRDVAARGRRARWLDDFKRRLGPEPRVVVVDGGLYGAERHALVRRARVMVDIHRVPNNSTGLRYLIGAAAGVALVSETSSDDWLPRPHEHVVEVSRSSLVDAVRTLLGDETRRIRLVEASQNLLRGELSMAVSLERVLRAGADTISPSK
ncbi:MAG TPA: hypothetical protein VEX62_09760 [Candidatus Limnocylindrales bacterium]|nr:hypothetical protein [Candidatus Limnocylindrales bacterium]